VQVLSGRPPITVTSARGAVRMYGFEGEAGREGEGVTRITESSYRRYRSRNAQGQASTVSIPCRSRETRAVVDNTSSA